MVPAQWKLAPLLLLWPMVAAGCSKEKLTALADQAKKTVAEQTEKVADSVKEQAGLATDAAKEQLALAGSCAVTLDAPMSTTACYVSFVLQGSERPAALQLRSYRNPDQESFPSVMVQAPVKAGGLSELVGQTVSAQLFVQQQQDSPIWSCPTGKHLDLKIVSWDEKLLQAEIVGGSVRNSLSGADLSVTGKFTAVLP